VCNTKSGHYRRQNRSREESLHFHELVHVVQWRHLGPEQILGRYANGLERFGYRQSPLERIAYDLEERFDREAQPFDAETECVAGIERMAESGNERRRLGGSRSPVRPPLRATSSRDILSTSRWRHVSSAGFPIPFS
jgi:hypothetical protein